MSSADYLYIDKAETLAAYCASLSHHPWLAMDTEFQREDTYFPKFCLLQIATPAGQVVVIDPQAIDDLSALIGAIYNKQCLKVLHSARQDFEIFYHLTGAVPRPLFDTQVAAPLLGYADQIGYASLVEQVLGVRLNKTETRTDWSKRPLSPKQLSYAVDDVAYLAQIYLKLNEKLTALGRLAWLDDELAPLGEPETYQSLPEQAWRRFRATDRMRGAQLGTLKRIAAWRERNAQNADRPRGWILRDEVLLDIALRLPESMSDLTHIRGLQERTAQKHGAEILDMIAQAKQSPEPGQPKPVSRPQESEDQAALADALMAIAKLRATEHQINPAVLASRKEIEKLLAGMDESECTHGWRAQILGKDLAAMLNGTACLKVRDRRLELAPCPSNPEPSTR